MLREEVINQWKSLMEKLTKERKFAMLLANEMCGGKIIPYFPRSEPLDEDLETWIQTFHQIENRKLDLMKDELDTDLESICQIAFMNVFKMFETLIRKAWSEKNYSEKLVKHLCSLDSFVEPVIVVKEIEITPNSGGVYYSKMKVWSDMITRSEAKCSSNCQIDLKCESYKVLFIESVEASTGSNIYTKEGYKKVESRNSPTHSIIPDWVRPIIEEVD